MSFPLFEHFRRLPVPHVTFTVTITGYDKTEGKKSKRRFLVRSWIVLECYEAYGRQSKLQGAKCEPSYAKALKRKTTKNCNYTSCPVKNLEYTRSQQPYDQKMFSFD